MSSLIYSVVGMVPVKFVPAPQSATQTAPSQKSQQKSRSGACKAVCLDYAMGQCHHPHCKYPHPDLAPLQRLREQFGHLGPICEVFALTGHCKFGAKCTKLHPDRKDEERSGERRTPEMFMTPEESSDDEPLEAIADSILEEKEWQENESKVVGDKLGNASTGGPDGKLLFGPAFAFDRVFWSVINDLNVLSF